MGSLLFIIHHCFQINIDLFGQDIKQTFSDTTIKGKVFTYTTPALRD